MTTPGETAGARGRLPVRVRLSGQTAAVSDPAAAERVIAAAIGRELGTFAASLGITAMMSVQVELAPGESDSAGQFSNPGNIELAVSEVVCRYPSILPIRVAAAADGRQPSISWSALDTAWLSGSSIEQRATFIALVCVESVKLNPAVLLGAAERQRCGDELTNAIGLPSRKSPVSVNWFGDVLASVLEMGISIGDITKMALLLGADIDELSDTQAAELLIAGLSQPSIELLVPEAIAESIVGEQSGNLLARVSATLFEETGIAFPPITVGTPVGWRDDSYAIRINDVSSLVMRPLGADEYLVNGTPEELAAHTPELPRSIIMPWAGRPAAVVPGAAVQQLSDLGWTVWSPTDYILAIAEHIIRTQAFKFVQQDRVFAQLETLERVHPAITKAALAELPLAPLTVLLRMLVRDSVSLGNLPAVLERVADRPAGLDEVARFDVLDDPVPPATELAEYGWEVEPMVAFVRVGLRDHIVQSVADGSRCLSVYLLDPAIEKLVLSPMRRPADDDAILDAFRLATARLAIGTATPIVLTTPRVRSDLQEVLRAALPELRVLAFNEIPANLSLRPLERVALQGSETSSDSWADIFDSAGSPDRWPDVSDDVPAGGPAVRAVDIAFPGSDGGKQVALRGVPQRVCAQCGLPVFSAGAVHRVEVLYREAVSGDIRRSTGVIT